MQLRPLGRSGLQVSPLCLGGNVFGWTADEKRSFELLDAFAGLASARATSRLIAGLPLLALRGPLGLAFAVALGIGLIVLVFLLWFVLTRGSATERVISPVKLPSPGEVFGSFGSLFATPVINQPQVAILSTDAIVRKPVVAVLPEATMPLVFGVHVV